MFSKKTKIGPLNEELLLAGYSGSISHMSYVPEGVIGKNYSCSPGE
jgi:hypothetical protein